MKRRGWSSPSIKREETNQGIMKKIGTKTEKARARAAYQLRRLSEEWGLATTGLQIARTGKGKFRLRESIEHAKKERKKKGVNSPGEKGSIPPPYTLPTFAKGERRRPKRSSTYMKTGKKNKILREKKSKESEEHGTHHTRRRNSHHNDNQGPIRLNKT